MKLRNLKQLIKEYKLIVLILFIIDLLIPDPLPVIDEIILGIATIYGFR